MPELAIRRAGTAGAYTHVHSDGTEHTLTAEQQSPGYWVVRPQNEDDERIADMFGLPRAQKAIQAEKTTGAAGKQED